jgi:hypothetical protein
LPLKTTAEGLGKQAELYKKTVQKLAEHVGKPGFYPVLVEAQTSHEILMNWELKFDNEVKSRKETERVKKIKLTVKSIRSDLAVAKGHLDQILSDYKKLQN